MDDQNNSISTIAANKEEAIGKDTNQDPDAPK
jgi:hypothetical protein